MAQFEALKAPLGRLHFAGEAFSFDYGFLQSAMNTGRDTANTVTSCINATPGSSRYRSCTSFTPSYLARGCTYAAAENYDEMAQEDNGSCQFDDMASTESNGSTRGQTLSSVCVVMIIALFYLMDAYRQAN